MRRKLLLSVMAAVLLLMAGVPARAQFMDCSTGLLQMPTADMQDDGTFMITNNFVNKNALSPRWGYNTFQYGIYVSFWGRMEIGYVCTIFNDHWKGSPSRDGSVWMINQDRHFTGRIRLLKEGEFGQNWIPSLVVGVSDPTTGAGGGEYISGTDKVSGTGNGFFNRFFIVMSKHFQTSWGEIGAHAGYQFNRRLDYPINAPCAGVNWSPIWLQHHGVLDGIDVVAEFDSRTVNLGFIASIWENRFEAMFELQNFQWVSFGLRYKLRIKRVK